MTLIQHRTARGFSLIEVLIAVVILSFGLLALAALQGTLLRSGAEAKARATATALAQEVIEEGRSFAFVDKPTADYTGATYVGLTAFAGKKVSAGGVGYTINRTVTRYNPLDTTHTPLTGAFNPAAAEFKQVEVNVSWTGSDGNNRAVILADSVASISPADAMNVVKGPFTLIDGPQVWIEPPNKDNPAVVPIAVGDDKSAASSNPVPRRFANADSNTAATLFSIHTFTGSTSGSEVLLNRKLDVAAVTCNCSVLNSPRSTSTNPSYEPTVWNGKQLTYMEPTVLPVGTPIGTWVDDSTPNKDIRAMCTTCCRDHHESSSRSVRPDPHRALTSTEQGGNEHYLTTVDNNGIDYTIGLPQKGEYSEACQLIRVAGQMRVSIDPKQNFLLTVPLNATETGHEPADFVTRYSSLVVKYITDGVGALPTGYLSPTAPFLAFDQDRYSCKGTGNASCDPGYSDILDPAPILLPLGSKQLVSFGLYVDYINSDTKKAYDCAGSTDTSDTSCDGLRERNKLETLPFYAINVANLGVWSLDVKGKDWLTVTSPTFGQKGILNGVGGKVSAVTSKIPSAASNCGTVKLDITRSSSGAAGRLPIDPDDNAASNKASNRAKNMAFVNGVTTENCTNN